MNQKKLLGCVCILFVLGSFYASQLRSYSSGPQVGLSGAPGEPSCDACHFSYPLNSGNALPSISSNIPAAGYEPGKTYTIRLKIAEPGVGRFGFESLMYSPQTEQEAGRVIWTDSVRTQIMSGPKGNYVMHTRDGIDEADSIEWRFDWVAPAAGSDTVAVYASFLSAVEAGNGFQGDYAYTRMLKIPEALPAGEPARVRLMLEAFMQGDRMSNALYENGLIPTQQPFSLPPFSYQDPAPALTPAPWQVDWILLEARDTLDPSQVIARQVAVLDTNGFAQSLDPQASLVFPNLPAGSYYLAVFHKSHLGVMSAQPLELSGQTPLNYDFTTAAEQAFGSEQLKTVGAVPALHAGDFDQNGILNNQDFNQWKQNAAAVDQYLPIDADGNGVVNNLDYNYWSVNKSKIGVVSQP